MFYRLYYKKWALLRTTGNKTKVNQLKHNYFFSIRKKLNILLYILGYLLLIFKQFLWIVFCKITQLLFNVILGGRTGERENTRSNRKTMEKHACIFYMFMVDLSGNASKWLLCETVLKDQYVPIKIQNKAEPFIHKLFYSSFRFIITHLISFLIIIFQIG